MLTDSEKHGFPVIGISPQYTQDGHFLATPIRYVKAFERSGAVSVVLPIFRDEAQIEAVCSLCDGILMSGGDDVDPALYGQAVDPKCGLITRDRDDFEIALTKAAMKRHLPLLGICRGIQLMCVATGGTLIQHKDGHMGTKHWVNADKDSMVAKITGETRIFVNSYHHQLCAVPGPGAKITVHAEDGGAEALELPDYKPYFLGLQWHPEMVEGDVCDKYSDMLIKSFTDAAREYREHR